MQQNGPQLTPQQTAAISTRGVSIALSAGAGCGKTFVLTRRFLTHLQPGGGLEARAGGLPLRSPPLRGGRSATEWRATEAEQAGSLPLRDGDPLSGIVAITFTERAAREMRDRIRAACHAELRRCSSDDVRHWLKILRGLDSARVSTIHSFCAALLRSHAVDAGVDPRFLLLEETMGDAFRRRVVMESVHALLSEHDDDCMQLVLHYGLERTVDLVRRLVMGEFEADYGRFDGHTAETLAADWVERWRDEFVPQLIRDVVESEGTKHLLRLLQEHRPGHAEMGRRCDLLLAGLPRLPGADDPAGLLAELREVAIVQGGGGKKVWPGESIYEEVKNGLTRLRGAIDGLQNDLALDETEIEAAASVSLMALGVTRRVGRDYEAKKHAAGLLDFDDLLLKTRNLLRDKEAVRKRAAAGIDFLMVDEFQDTDPVQAEIVGHLCGGGLLAGKLFLVGDAKQSIYRFRRADPQVFASLRSRIPEAGRLPLSVNFRSQPEILKFVNCLFAPAMRDEYEPLVPHVEQLSPTPAVEFLFAVPEQEEASRGVDGQAGSSPLRSPPLRGGTAATEWRATETAPQRREREAEWIARRVLAMLNDETPRIRIKDPSTGKATLRRVEAGDVAILFRTLNNVAGYEEALREYGIGYYLVGGRAFYAQQEIYDLINLCQFLNDCDDQVSLAGVLRSPFFSLSDDALFAMADQAGSLVAALEQRPPSWLPEDQQRQIAHAGRVLGELRRLKDRLPLAELIGLALERTGYDAALLNEHLGRRKLANLRKLIDMARQYDRSGLYTLSDFVQRMRDSVAEQTDEELAATHPEKSDVVRLMTVHQAKGLEFPVVVVADMDWTRRGGYTPAHFHPELGPLVPLPTKHGESPENLGLKMHRHIEARGDEAETVRLLYVATTRAADCLILSAGLDANRKLSSPWLNLLAARFDLETGLPAVDPYLGRISLGDVSPEDIPQILVHRRTPDVAKPAGTDDGRLPLGKFRETVEQADPAPLPALLRRIEPDVASRRQFTVSEIRRADSDVTEPASIFAGDENAEIEFGEEFESEDAQVLGTLVHRAIERVALGGEGACEPDSLDALVETCLATVSGTRNGKMHTAVLKRVQAFVTSPVFAELVEAKRCFREVDFLLAWPPDAVGNALRGVPSPRGGASRTNRGTPQRAFPTETPAIITGQIDCLYETPDDHWRVIDYKTGRLPAGGPQALLAEYDLQLALYALATRELTGQLPDRAELVLLHDKVRHVTYELTDAALDQVCQRIDAAIARLRSPQSRELVSA